MRNIMNLLALTAVVLGMSGCSGQASLPEDNLYGKGSGSTTNIYNMGGSADGGSSADGGAYVAQDTGPADPCANVYCGTDKHCAAVGTLGVCYWDKPAADAGTTQQTDTGNGNGSMTIGQEYACSQSTTSYVWCEGSGSGAKAKMATYQPNVCIYKGAGATPDWKFLGFVSIVSCDDGLATTSDVCGEGVIGGCSHTYIGGNTGGADAGSTGSADAGTTDTGSTVSSAATGDEWRIPVTAGSDVGQACTFVGSTNFNADACKNWHALPVVNDATTGNVAMWSISKTGTVGFFFVGHYVAGAIYNNAAFDPGYNDIATASNVQLKRDYPVYNYVKATNSQSLGYTASVANSTSETYRCHNGQLPATGWCVSDQVSQQGTAKSAPIGIFGR